MNPIRTYLPHAIALVASLVFLDSLRFKFTNAVETQVIFGKLNAWASSLGAPGLFAPTGLFSQYVIGSAELVASALLLVGIHPAFAVMSGAVNFHLWTPLGIDPNNDGGGLFFMACTVWVTSIVLIVIRRRELAAIGQGLAATFLPGRGADAGASASPGAVPANSN